MVTRLQNTTRVLTWIVFLAVLLGCGYRFSPIGGSASPEGGGIGRQFHTIAIPMLKSSTTFPGLEADFTTAFREEFISRSGLELVPEKDADVVLEARITRITAAPSAYSVEEFTLGNLKAEYETTSRRTLKVRLWARLIHRGSGRVIWEEARMEERGTYQVGSDPLLNLHNERQAYLDIGRRLARRVFLKTVERF